jgi:hypothetical protein
MEAKPMDRGTSREVGRLREAGWTQAAIAAELGLSKGAVWRACQDDGPQPRPRAVATGGRAEDETDAAGGALVVPVVLVVLVLWFVVPKLVNWWNHRGDEQPGDPERRAWFVVPKLVNWWHHRNDEQPGDPERHG